jgi:hypothetical protein
VRDVSVFDDCGRRDTGTPEDIAWEVLNDGGESSGCANIDAAPDLYDGCAVCCHSLVDLMLVHGPILIWSSQYSELKGMMKKICKAYPSGQAKTRIHT